MQNESERISTSPEQTVSQLFDLVKSFEHKLAEQQTTFESENKQLQEKVSRLETALQHKNLEVAAELGEVRTSRRRLFKKMGVAAAGALAAGTLAVTTNLPAAEAASGVGNISFNGEGAPVNGATPNYNRTDGTTTFSTTNPPLAGGALPGTSSIEIYNNRTVGAIINGLFVRTQSNSGVPITGQSDTSGAASGLIGIAGTVAGFTPEVGVDPASAGVTGNSSATTGVYGVSSSLSGAGVYGLSQNGVGVIGKSLNSYGGQFSTKLANKGQLYLKPASGIGAPTINGNLGELYVDVKGVAYIFMDDGTGTPKWKSLAVSNPTYKLNFLSFPDRFCDTRDPTIGGQTGLLKGGAPYGNGEFVDITIVGPTHLGRDGNPIPIGAIGVVGNFSAISSTAPGLLRVLPGGTTPTLGTALLNPGAGVNVSNAFNCRLNASGQVRVAVFNTPSVHFLIDIVGYYA